MKKKLLIMILFMLLLLGISTISYGAISATSKTVNSGESVTISVSSSETLGAYAIQVTDNGGLTFVSSSAPAGFAANGAKISGASTTGVTSLGSFTFKVPSVSTDTNFYVKISSSGTEGPGPNYANVDPSTAKATITVKAPVSKPSPTPTPAPTFQSVSQTVYATTEVNVRSSYSTSSSRIGSIQKGQSVTRTGIGSNGWSRVTFNGQTGYVNSQYLTTTKPSDEPTTEPSTPPQDQKSNDATLKSLSITGVTLTPTFDPNVTSYVANIGTDINEVEVIAEVNNEKATREITGNTELKDGENIITVAVTAEDGTVTNYEIKLIRSDVVIPLDVLSLVGIKENDERIDISLGEPSVTENIVEYTISLSEYMKAIDILKASSEDLNVYEGTGTFDLKVGENKFTVILKITKDNEETQTIEYRLTINNPEKVVAKAETKINYKLILIIGAIVLITIIGITFAILYYRKQDDMEYAKPDYSFLREDDEKPKDTLQQIYDEKNNGKNGDDDDNFRRGGRHF